VVNIKKALFYLIIALTLVSSNAIANTTDWVLPISKNTPGVINTNVTQNNIKNNICKANWTSTVRPPVSYTNKLKLNQLKTSYSSFVKIWGSNPANYEEDHLISLQLGGNPIDPKNLFPQPYAGNNARKKDIIETKLKTLVCSGKITLKDAQTMIATNWVLAYNKYITSSDSNLAIDKNN
jgi:hypothetical protein